MRAKALMQISAALECANIYKLCVMNDVGNFGALLVCFVSLVFLLDERVKRAFSCLLRFIEMFDRRKKSLREEGSNIEVFFRAKLSNLCSLSRSLSFLYQSIKVGDCSMRGGEVAQLHALHNRHTCRRTYCG
jgi:hypothetical protein